MAVHDLALVALGEECDMEHQLRILAAIDRSEAAGLVTKCLLEIHARSNSVEVVLLNVQPTPQAWQLRRHGCFSREVTDSRLIDLGKRAVTAVARHLDAAGLPHEDRVELGDPAETMIRHANEEHCDLIVLAEPKPGVVRDWLMRSTGFAIGSVTRKVIRFARVPIMIAK